MLGNEITFKNAYENVKYYLTPNKKGKIPLETEQFPFTTFANACKVLESYERHYVYVPTQAEQARNLLQAVKVYHETGKGLPVNLPEIKNE